MKRSSRLVGMIFSSDIVIEFDLSLNEEQCDSTDSTFQEKLCDTLFIVCYLKSKDHVYESEL